MKKEGSYLLISKVLVISRLLHNALSQSKSKPPILDQLWEKLLSIRRKLFRRIDKQLASTNSEPASLVESMCAYALITRSSPTEVLNHFLKLRLDKVNSDLRQGGDELAKHSTGALKLCIQTCLDTQTIFPRRLADGLAKLKTQPLIQDPGVRGLYELNLDVHGRWIGDDARNYTPWSRHDALQRPEAEKILSLWSKDAIAAFLKGIKKALEGEERLKEVAHLRQELIETWIMSGSRMAGVKSANVLDDLRDTMNEKLESIVQSRTQKLEAVVSDLMSQLEGSSSTSNATDLSLWKTTSQASNLTNGAQSFKSTILNTSQGQDESVIHIISAFDKWMESVLEVKSIIKSMKEARWDDTFADDVDDDSDDDLGDSKQTLLADDDPRVLEDTTQEALSETLKQLGQSFTAVVKSSMDDSEGGSTKKAILILRVIREIGDRIPQLKLQEKSTPLPSPFTADILQPLYTIITTSIVQPMIKAYQKTVEASKATKTNSHILWDGNPPLPSQSSPSAFRFLRDLNKSMGTLGADLWTSSSVSVLKGKTAEEMIKVFEQQLRTLETQEKEEESSKPADKDEDASENGENSEEKQKEKTVSPQDAKQLREQNTKQLVFDAQYIQRFLATSTQDDGLSPLVDKIEGVDLDDSAKQRLKKNAADYVKKTYLLFALLA